MQHKHRLRLTRLDICSASHLLALLCSTVDTSPEKLDQSAWAAGERPLELHESIEEVLAASAYDAACCCRRRLAALVPMPCRPRAVNDSSPTFDHASWPFAWLMATVPFVCIRMNCRHF